MARTKKVAQTESEEILTEQNVWDILKFAQALNSYYPSVYTPQLINSRLKDVSLLNTGSVTEDRVERALANPKDSENELLAISENLEYSSMSYKRILQYMANLPSWDLTYYCKNAEGLEAYKSPKYKKALNIIKDFLNKFDYRKEFSTVIKQLFRQEAYFCVLRDEGDIYSLQELSPDYCLITGRWDYGLLFTFNYMFFQRGGISIEWFPDIFKTTYASIFTKPQPIYDPSVNVDLRGKDYWTYWADCSPKDNFWAWKLSPEIATRIPYFSGLFPDFAMQPLIRGLQKSSYMAAAAKLVFGEVPFNDDSKAALKDNIKINPTLLGQFMQLIRSGINNEAIRVASAPLKDIKAMEFNADNEIYSSWLHTTLGAAGINSNLLFSGDTKPNQVETMLSANVDEIVSQGIYPYFNSFLEYHINKKLEEASPKIEYRFKFRFEGSNFYTDRKRRLDTQMDLMDKGFVNVQSLSAALGKNVFELQSQLDEARAMGWVDNLTPIVPANQLNAEAVNGRPTKNEEDLTDSGAETRDRGSNESKQ